MCLSSYRIMRAITMHALKHWYGAVTGSCSVLSMVAYLLTSHKWYSYLKNKQPNPGRWKH
jgi:hypothetical protein